MEKKTVEMIRFIKHHAGDYPTLRDAAIAYMMQYSGCDRSVYTKDRIEGIVFEIFCDFIDACDKPSVQLRQMMDSFRIQSYIPEENFNTVFDYMLSAMMLCRVKDGNGNYVNGFKEEDFQQSVDFNLKKD